MQKILLLIFLSFIFSINVFASDEPYFLMTYDNANLFIANVSEVNNKEITVKVVRKIKGEIIENKELKIPYFEYVALKSTIPKVNDICFIAYADQKLYFAIKTTSTDLKTLKFIDTITNQSMNMEGNSMYESYQEFINNGSYEKAENERMQKLFQANLISLTKKTLGLVSVFFVFIAIFIGIKKLLIK